MFDKLVDLLIQFLGLFRFWTIIKDWEMGIMLRLGRFHRMADPGFHWRWPFNIEECYYAPVNMMTRIVGPQSLTTKDGVSLIISVVITEQIEDVKKFLVTANHGRSIVEDCTYGAVATVVHDKTWRELEEMDLARTLEITVRRQAKKYGVDIVQLQLVDFTRSKSFRLMQSHVEGTE
jgi:regulator of protease activity HflC (stomatin/prohibitin superfamily)